MNIPPFYKISQEEFDDTKVDDYIPIECTSCKNIFKSRKCNILRSFRYDDRVTQYCSAKCQVKEKHCKIENKEFTCIFCDITFEKIVYDSKKVYNYCGKSCQSKHTQSKIIRTPKIKNIKAKKQLSKIVSIESKIIEIKKYYGIDKFIHSQMYTRKSKNLIKLGFYFDKPVVDEYMKIQSLLYSEYHIKLESMLTIMKKFGIPSAKTIHGLFEIFDIQSRSFSESLDNAVSQNRHSIGTSGKTAHKTKWHTTWEGKQVYLRSSYEIEYAEQLDIKKIKYEVEALRIKYFDIEKNKYRIAIPDFYLPETNTIVEIKSDYWLDSINMQAKVESYKNMGFNFILELNKKSYPNWSTSWGTIPESTV